MSGGPAVAARAHRRDPLAGPDHEIDVMQDGPARRVPETHLFEPDLPAGPGTRAGLQTAHETWRLFQLLEYALGRGSGLVTTCIEPPRSPPPQSNE